jgi:hypothetical protein
MNEPIVLNGTLLGDGTLVLDEKPSLPSGRVQVTLRHVPSQAFDEFVAMIDKLRANQLARGHLPRAQSEIDAEIRQMREEWESRKIAIE